MKVISGKMRGMNLYTNLDRFTRPTEGKIKEAIFSVIFQVKPKSKAWDLFAGSGAVGIEFISRGCDLVVFSEASNDNIKCINENIEHTKSQEFAKVFKGDFKKNLLNIKRQGLKFDYVFIDPPYERLNYYKESIEMLIDNDLLNDDCLVILESEKELSDVYFKNLKLEKQKQYGKKKNIYFLRNDNE